MRGESENMSWVEWLITHWEMIFTVALIVFVGIPFLTVMIIPALVFIGGKRNSKWFPSFEFLMKYFEVDITKPPYSEWMDKHPLIFVGLTSVELYISYMLIHVLRPIKKIFKGDSNQFEKNTG
jgi:hypothetical protein